VTAPLHTDAWETDGLISDSDVAPAGTSSDVGLVVGLGGGLVVTILIAVLVIFILRRRRDGKYHGVSRHGLSEDFTGSSTSYVDGWRHEALMEFTRELKRAESECGSLYTVHADNMDELL
jgi:hypothetical protein